MVCLNAPPLLTGSKISPYHQTPPSSFFPPHLWQPFLRAFTNPAVSLARANLNSDCFFFFRLSKPKYTLNSPLSGNNLLPGAWALSCHLIVSPSSGPSTSFVNLTVGCPVLPNFSSASTCLSFEFPHLSLLALLFPPPLLLRPCSSSINENAVTPWLLKG